MCFTSTSNREDDGYINIYTCLITLTENKIIITSPNHLVPIVMHDITTLMHQCVTKGCMDIFTQPDQLVPIVMHDITTLMHQCVTKGGMDIFTQPDQLTLPSQSISIAADTILCLNI